MFDMYDNLCTDCFTKITTFPCCLCKSHFNVLKDRKNDLLNNFIEYRIDNQKISSSKHICNTCYVVHVRCKCSRCSGVFRSETDKSDSYKTDTEIKKWLKPYNKHYSDTLGKLCVNCFHDCKKACQEVEKQESSWIGGVKSEYLRGYKTVKSLGRVDYKGKDCSEPDQVENKLKRYSAQLGGNGFVKYYWDKHETRSAKKVLAGYSKNDNPYYRTEYSTKRWFTGYATAIIAQPFEPKRPNTVHQTSPIQINRSNIQMVVLDGLNICGWSSTDELQPDIAILLTLCISLAEDKLPFICFFDANTRHIFRDKLSVKDEDIYVDLIRNFKSSHFIEVPGRTQADDFILQKADSENGYILSNDQFRDNRKKHLWLSDERRLLKGTVANGNIMVPGLQLDLRIRKDIQKALISLYHILME